MDFFTDNLQLIRKRMLLSQNDMAEKMNVSYRAYSSYERGERKPTYDFLQKLVEDYNINLNFLIANQGEMFNTPPETSGDDFEKRLKRIETVLKDAGFNLDKNSCGL